MITIGIITKPVGLKGAVRVKPLTASPKRFLLLKSVYINGEKIAIERVSISKNMVTLALKGLDSISQAENFRGAEIAIDKSQVILEQGEYLVGDLIGASVETQQGKLLGEIFDINSYGSADVISCNKNGARNFHFPHLDWVVKKIDIEAKKMVVDFSEFEKVVSYED